MKIKICYVISSLSNQGPPNVLYNIIRYIDFDKFEVCIITMVPEQKISRIDDFRQLPIKVVQMSPNKCLNPIAMFKILKSVINKLDPDIVHGHCPRSDFLIPFLPNKYIKAETIHIYPGLQQKVLYGKLKGQLVIWLSNFFVRFMDLPIACAESVSELYYKRQHFKTLPIPNGSSLPVFVYDRELKIKLRHKFGMKDGVKYFIFIGRFSQEKNPNMIVRAFKEMNRNDIGVILLGNGILYEKLKLQESENILMPGFTSNVYNYLIASDYYISASSVEGLANTVLESMTVGLPMVLSNIPSHNEILTHVNGTVGYIMNQYSIDDIKDKIIKVLNLDVYNVRKELQATYLKYYTADFMSRKYQQAYVDILRKKNKEN